MSKEAMKLALEALDNLMYWDNGKPDYDEARQAITALREALAKPDFWEGYVPEPVKPAQRCPLCNYQYGHAIGCKNNPVDIALDKKAENARELGLDYEPAQQEPVAYPEGDVVGPCICGSWPGGKCLKCPRITTPAQRTWVGLTDEEIDTLREANSEGRGAGWRFNFKGFARAIEAKLKEKNNG